MVVKDVKPYEFMKLRLLNGGHSCLSYISVLCGYNYVDDAMANPLISGTDIATPSCTALINITLRCTIQHYFTCVTSHGRRLHCSNYLTMRHYPPVN